MACRSRRTYIRCQPRCSSRARTTVELEPVARREPAMRFAGAGVGSRGAIALKHGAGLPAGDPHEVGLATTPGEPLVREVSELMRVAPWEARLRAATAQQIHQPPSSEAALLPEAEPRQSGVLVGGAGAQVAVQRLASLAPKRQGPLATALAEHHLGQVVAEECVWGHLDRRDLLSGGRLRPFAATHAGLATALTNPTFARAGRHAPPQDRTQPQIMGVPPVRPLRS